MNEKALHRPKIGLALGSGSARGLAHLGVIQALKDADVEIDCVAGSGTGALIGAIHAAGKLAAFNSLFKRLDLKKAISSFGVALPKSGLIDGDRASEVMRTYIPASSIETLPISFAAVATDLVSGQEIVITHGDLNDAVRASLSVPGIFTPVRRHGRLLVDGSLANPVPVSAARRMGADVVIGVDLNSDMVTRNIEPLLQNKHAILEQTDLGSWAGGYLQILKDIRTWLRSQDLPGAVLLRNWTPNEEGLPNLFEVLLASINITETHITQTRLKLDQPDMLIRPPLGHIHFLEFGSGEEIIEIGYQSTLRQLTEWTKNTT